MSALVGESGLSEELHRRLGHPGEVTSVDAGDLNGQLLGPDPPQLRQLNERMDLLVGERGLGGARLTKPECGEDRLRFLDRQATGGFDVDRAGGALFALMRHERVQSWFVRVFALYGPPDGRLG